MVYPDLDGKVALVTGGGFGIGRETVLAYVRNGVKVAIADINEAGAQAVAAEVAALGGDALVIKVDVSRQAEVEAMVQHVVAHFGSLDIAFNNAGIDLEHGLITQTEEESFDRMMAVNVKGVWLCMKYEIEQMLKQGGGAIINTASIGGVIASPKMAIYGATKHAVVGMTKSAAVEFGRKGIRINSVCPAVINTEMTARAMEKDPKIADTIVRAHPIGRLGEPDDIANAVLFLSSEASSFVLGHQLLVDGGFTAV
jgi:NAD(P)-dependent dehydrogenase (short-subunit alcohol dehydrogenase family)